MKQESNSRHPWTFGKRILPFAACALFSSTLAAGFPEDFQNAAKLPAAESAARFMSLAETAGGEAKNKALFEAGRRYLDLGKIADAEKAAAAADGTTAERLKLKILFAKKQWKEILAFCGEKDFSLQPESDQFDGYFIRAMAHFRSGNQEKALADLEQAGSLTEEPLGRASVLSMRAQVLEAMGKKEEALAEYRKIIVMKNLEGFGYHSGACIGAARILTAEGKYEDALAELASIKKSASGYWAYTPLLEEARVLKAMGREKEASEKTAEAEKLRNPGR